MTPWIGVDLDGTLAHYNKWQGFNHIGAPIAPMVDRIKAWLKDGIEVRIVTARYAAHNQPDTCLDVVTPIEEWCLQHIGQILPVTNAKDGAMIELWDDRAIQVLTNTGNPVAPPQLRMRPASEMILTQADINLCLGSQELLPCPFCGSSPMSSGEVTPNGKAIHWKIQCTGRDIMPSCGGGVWATDSDQDQARQEAIQRWNRRTP